MRKIDLFSSQFCFNVDTQQTKRGSTCGALLTLITVVTAITYLIYLSMEYFNNQIDPKFRTQSFISEDQIDVDLNQDLVGFRFEFLPNQTVDELQVIQNKTYLVYKPVYFYQNMENYEYYPLDIINCTSPHLEGYNCLDFSQIKNYTLTISTKNNFLSQIFILVYGCNDIDTVKTTIPDNCADQSDIDYIINNQYSNLRLKLKTTQFNATSKQIQVNYKNSFIFTSGNQNIQARFKAQQQITIVKQGFLLQYQNAYSDPINYDTFNEQFDRNYANQSTGVSPYVQASISMDELVYLTNIQFPIFPEILAIVNSIITIMMTVGIIGRTCAQKLMKQQFFLLFLQNLYLDTYEQILQVNNKLKKSENFSLYKKPDDLQIGDEYEGHKSSQSIAIPQMQIKSKMQPNLPTLESQKQDQINEQQDQQLLEQNDLIYNQTLPTEQNMTEYSSNFSKSNKHISPQQTFTKNNKLTYFSPFNIKPKIKRKVISHQNLLKNQSSCQIQISGQQKFKLSIDKTKLFKTQNSSFNKTQQLNGLSTQQSTQSQPQIQDSSLIIDYLASKLKIIQSLDISKSLSNKIFGSSLWKSNQSKEFPDLDKSVQKVIEQQVNKSLDIFQLYRDIIFLKKAVMVLLTKDQLAALSLVGCSPTFLIQSGNPNSSNNQENRNKKNHFQKQLAISLSEDLQNKYLKKFISKCSNENNINETDYRIITSIIKNETL